MQETGGSLGTEKADSFCCPPGGLLHILLVSLDHLLDHLAADRAGFPGGQVTVVAVLQVNADFLGSLHLELVHSFLGLGNIDPVVIVAHFVFSPSVIYRKGRRFPAGEHHFLSVTLV